MAGAMSNPTTTIRAVGRSESKADPPSEAPGVRRRGGNAGERIAGASRRVVPACDF
jgi:hypothetical protein